MPVATPALRRRNFTDLRFGLSFGPVAAGLVAVDLAAGGLDDGEPPAARQQFLSKQDFSRNSATGERQTRLCWWPQLRVVAIEMSRQDYILVRELICPICKLIAGVSAPIFG